MVNECKEKGVHYTGKYYSKHIGRTYLIKYSNELNIIADYVRKCLGLCYTTSLIKYHHKTQVFDAVFKSTVNIAFYIIQP